jgi:hypothetical protein
MTIRVTTSQGIPHDRLTAIANEVGEGARMACLRDGVRVIVLISTDEGGGAMAVGYEGMDPRIGEDMASHERGFEAARQQFRAAVN